jgi:predicted  nucleic acid-binding Zn-ribbon protein
MWNGLVDKNSLKYSNEEIEKVKSISELLHSENERLRLEVDSLTKGRANLLEKIQEQEKIKQSLQKELQKTLQNLKYETKAREGLSKKMTVFEYEAVKYKEECFNQREELALVKYRNKDLEYRLNQERSKRLCELHEMDLLKKRNLELESAGSHAEKEAMEARMSLHDKLEKLEGIMHQNESQKRIISSMSGEILTLNSEMASLKEDLKRALEGKYHHENTISSKVREVEGLEREVSKLRRDLAVGLKGTWGSHSLGDLLEEDGLGLGGSSTSSSQHSRHGHTLPAMASLRKSQDVISMSATPFSASYSSATHSPTTHLHANTSLLSPSSSSPALTHSFQPSELQGKRYNRGPFSVSHSSPPSSPGTRQRFTSSDLLLAQPPHRTGTHGSSGLRPGEGLSAGPKSRFTGSGLGLKKSEVPDFNPKGSAKSVLKKILKEQQEKEGR